MLSHLTGHSNTSLLPGCTIPAYRSRPGSDPLLDLAHLDLLPDLDCPYLLPDP